MTGQFTAYTPLESLLLFQSLRTDGVTPTSFNRISEQLKALPLVRSDPTYDAGRLSPDALRLLYLVLLKEEVKQDLEISFELQDHVTNGAGAAAVRKRKASSPTLPTVQEAAQHSHLIPQLVIRLYTRYREKTVRELREYERKYEMLTREIADIEAGKWDERLQRMRSASATRNPDPPVSARVEADEQDVPPATAKTAVVTTSTQDPEDSVAQSVTKPYSQAKIDAVINHGPEPQLPPAGHRRTSSGPTLPPISELAPRSPGYSVPPNVASQIARTPSLQHGNGHVYNPSPSSAHPSPFASHHAHPLPSQHAQSSFGRPISSPRPILPPPPGMPLPPPPLQHAGSPSVHMPQIPPHSHYPPLAQASAGPSRHSPLDDHPLRVRYPPSTMGYAQTLHNHYPPHQQYPDRRTSYQPPPVAGQTNYQPQPFHHAGQQMQPFSNNQLSQPSRPVPRPAALQGTLQTQQSPIDKMMPSHLQHSASAPPTSVKQALQPKPRLITEIVAALATPPKQPLWKSESKPTPHAMRQEPEHPGFEPLSPSKERAKPVAQHGRPNRSSVGGEVSGVKSASRPITRKRPPARDNSSQSVMSSAAGGLSAAQTRSRSASTTPSAALPSDDRPGSKEIVKHEPSTPAATIEGPESAQRPSTTPASSGPMTRRRRGTLQSQPQLPAKRKRREESAENEAADTGTPPPRPTTITATRNFAKMSVTIMNDINSHKHASYFAVPVRDRDATGYSEIIKQPQNLKSIRVAINAGARAVAAAVSSSASTESLTSKNVATADGSMTVELERSVELMPPTAIVNGVQLEKEVYRMLANAVMFNPGEDGLVQEAREMFADVQANIGEWRGAEEDVGEGKGKRRKM